MYKLQVIRYENNERYEAELADYKDRSRYGGMRVDGTDYPRQEVSKNALEVYITEEQFEAIRKAVIEKF